MSKSDLDAINEEKMPHMDMRRINAKKGELE